MFETQKIWAAAMMADREFDGSDGCRYKFFAENWGNSSPFKVFTNGEWRNMGISWMEHGNVIEIFKDQPDLKIDTEVLVSDKFDGEWERAHFSNYGDNHSMVCFADGKTSETKEYHQWRYWKVDNGAHKGKSNVKQEPIKIKKVKHSTGE